MKPTKPQTKEEENVLMMWRHLRQWEKLAVALLLNTTTVGRLTEQGDRQSLKQMRRMLNLK